MDIRRYAVAATIAACALTTNLSYAEGGQYLPQDNCKENGIYIDGMLGYAQTNWKNTLGGITSTDISLNWSRGSGSFTGGADIGYAFNRYIGVELGGFGWQQWTVSGIDTSVTPNVRLQDTGRTYAVYVAAKFTVPAFNFDNFDFYAKAGAGYQKFSLSGNLTGFNIVTNATSHVGPMFAVGGEYWITNNFYATLQLTRFSGVDSNHVEAYSTNALNGKTITSPNLITVGIGYFFNL